MSSREYKIAIVITALGPGGAERVTSLQANYLADKGHEVHLITLANNPPDHYPLNLEEMNRIRFEGDDPEQLLNYLTFEGIDIVLDHIHWSEQHYKFFELLNASRVKLIIFDHSTYFYPLHYRWRWPMFQMRVKAYNAADAITALTRHTCALYRQKVPATVLMPNPLSYKSKKTADVSKNRKIVALANWTRHEKRLDRAIEIIAKLSNKHDDTSLCLVGPYRDHELANSLKVFGVPKKMVEFVGRQESVQNYYLDARACISVSNLEGFGLTLTEAAIHGVPRVAMFSPGLEDIIDHDTDGFLVKQGDIRSAVDYLSRLLSDDELAVEMGQKAKTSARKFTLSKIGARWEWLIDSVMNSSGSELLKIIEEDSEENGVSNVRLDQICADYDHQISFLLERQNKQDPGSYISSDQLKEINQFVDQQRRVIEHESKILGILRTTLFHLENRKLAKLVEKSPLFDEDWYLKEYPDVKASRIPPALHYLIHGAREGRNPGPNFDTMAYLNSHRYLMYQDQNPLLHKQRSDETERHQIGKSVSNTKGHKWLAADQAWLNEFTSNPAELTILHPDFLGVKQSASQFVSENHILPIMDDLDDLATDYYSSLILEAEPKQIIFQGLNTSYATLAQVINERSPNLPILCMYHGSFVQQRHQTERDCLSKIIEFYHAGIISKVGLVKKGMAESLQSIGIDAAFVMNFIKDIPEGPSRVKGTRIGVIGSEWNERKPIYQQLVATKHVPHDELIVLGSGEFTKTFCRQFDIHARHLDKVSQKEMGKFLAANTLNIYVTLSECAPMLPIESLSVGAPCLFGSNNHYFDDNEYLRNRLVVNIPDSETDIARAANLAIEERENIIHEYIKYAKSYNQKAMQSFSDFLILP